MKEQNPWVEFWDAVHGPRPILSDGEMELVWRHLLNSPWEDASAPAARIRDALFAESAGMTQLTRLKELAKSLASELHPDFPEDAARMLYVCCLASVRAMSKTPTTQHGDEKFKALLEWATKKTWMDPECRELLRREKLCH